MIQSRRTLKGAEIQEGETVRTPILGALLPSSWLSWFKSGHSAHLIFILLASMALFSTVDSGAADKAPPEFFGTVLDSTGNRLEGIDIQKGGTIEIKGTVNSSDGTPLPNVKVKTGYNTYHFRNTNEEGRFDFGTLPLEQKIRKPPRLTFLPPRPKFCFGQGGSSRENDVDLPIPSDTIFYHHKRLDLSISAPVHDVSVTLEPAEWITLKGLLTDSEGQPVDGGKIILFGGNPTDDHWTRIFTGSGLTRPGQNDYREIYFAYTKEGVWEMPIVLENKADYRSAYHWINSATGYSLGAFGRRGDKALLQDIALSPDDDGRLFKIQLEDRPPEIQ